MPRRKKAPKKGDWFHHIPLGRRRFLQRISSQRSKDRRRYGEIRLDLETPAIAPFPVKMLWQHGRVMIVNGVRTKVFLTRDIAKLYKLEKDTCDKWRQRGLLPRPYLTRKMALGQQALWLACQIRAVVRVYNDIFEQGFKRLPNERLLAGHMAMLERGNEVMLQRFERQVAKAERARNKEVDFGVIWEG